VLICPPGEEEWDDGIRKCKRLHFESKKICPCKRLQEGIISITKSQVKKNLLEFFSSFPQRVPLWGTCPTTVLPDIRRFKKTGTGARSWELGKAIGSRE
jgi:hypothetical protein